MTFISAIFLAALIRSAVFSTSCEMLKKSYYDSSHLIEKASGTELKICTTKSSTCCSRDIEQQMILNAEKMFKSYLQDKVIVLRHTISSHLNSFKSYFYNSLNACQNHLDIMFMRTYGPFYRSNSRVFDTFFNRLRAFSSPFSEINVTQITSHLFKDMFKIIFYILNPLHEITESQWKCMSDEMKNISPFGDLPRKITTHLEKILSNWKQFISTLSAVHSVLERFMNITLSSECVTNLVRMSECSLCSVAKVTKPCPRLCTSVMKRCLAEWSEIDQQWNAVVGSLIKMSQRLRGPHNLQNALIPLPVQISEAIMTFQERGATTTNKVLALCFSMDKENSSFTYRSKRATWLRRAVDEDDVNSRLLNTLMSTFENRFSSMINWFGSLTSNYCYNDDVKENDDQCWNGFGIGKYEKSIADNGLTSQITNLEYITEKRLHYKGIFIEERLRLGILSFRLQNFMSGRNNSNYDFEGSAYHDDEDYNEGSGDISILPISSKAEISTKISKVRSKISIRRGSLNNVLLITILIRFFYVVNFITL